MDSSLTCHTVTRCFAASTGPSTGVEGDMVTPVFPLGCRAHARARAHTPGAQQPHMHACAHTHACRLSDVMLEGVLQSCIGSLHALDVGGCRVPTHCEPTSGLPFCSASAACQLAATFIWVATTAWCVDHGSAVNLTRVQLNHAAQLEKLNLDGCRQLQTLVFPDRHKLQQLPSPAGCPLLRTAAPAAFQ